MKDMLDGMQELMTGERPYFDELWYDELVACFDQFDPLLMQSQDAQWEGFRTFAAAGGSEVDEWKQCGEQVCQRTTTWGPYSGEREYIGRFLSN